MIRLEREDARQEMWAVGSSSAGSRAVTEHLASLHSAWSLVGTTYRFGAETKPQIRTHNVHSPFAHTVGS